MNTAPPASPSLPRPGTWLLCLLLAAAVSDPRLAADEKPAPGPPPADVAETETETAQPPKKPSLPKRYASWLDEVASLIIQPERQLFLSLKKDYQRDAFIQQFWRVRDPYPETPRNELKERWPLRVAEAKNEYGSLTDDRARIYMIHGEPAGSFKVLCTKTRVPAEVWFYQGSEISDQTVLLVFYKLRSDAEARVWVPDQGRIVLEQILNRTRSCLNASRLQQALGVIAALDHYPQELRRFLIKPQPASREWLQTFVAFSTDLPPGAEPLDGAIDFAFLGRHQHRTVVHGLINVAAADVAVGEYAGYRSHDLLLTGEVIIGDSLFESFRYKYGFPEQRTAGTIPLAFQRFLRPGSYRLILKLEDLNSKRVLRRERKLEVPQVDRAYALPTFKDPRTEELFKEATAAIEAGETSLRLIPPHGDLHTGFVRFDSLVSGDVQKIRFYLDDKFILAKNRPPYSVEIDLGDYPDLHTLRAEGYDGDGNEVASDEILINSGGYGFSLKLVEPRKGKRYTQSLRARMEIQVPDNRSLDRVELYLNEKLAATLYQEPWVHPIILPDSTEIAYVRAVAYLPDGNSTEDVAFINAPDYLEEIDVQFVELYTTVLDNGGRPVEGLGQGDFRVFEDKVPQKIARFDRVENLPIHVGILIDNSASMVGTLGTVRQAALSFFQQAITAKDRAAVITFNSFPHLAVELTNDRTALGSGLAGLVAEGQTALYDSVMFALYYFTGIKGQRAILVLSDGKDESSRFDFDETLEYARRAGITIYPIGFRLSDFGARQKLSRLADETGGRSFFIRDIEALGDIYAQIQRELRSQYLIAYQSSNTDQSEDFRSVDLRVDRKDLVVKTLSGYYP